MMDKVQTGVKCKTPLKKTLKINRSEVQDTPNRGEVQDSSEEDFENK